MTPGRQEHESLCEPQARPGWQAVVPSSPAAPHSLHVLSQTLELTCLALQSYARVCRPCELLQFSFF